MRALLLSTIVIPGLFSAGARAELLFLNLNDTNKEIAACQEGLPPGEKLEVVDGVAGRDQNGFTKTLYALRDKMRALRAENRRRKEQGLPEKKFEGIIISGDHDSGLFFGKKGEFHYREIRRLMSSYPELEESLRTSALWGCYPTTFSGAQNFWIGPMPNMNHAEGFMGQAPAEDKEANLVLMKDYCSRYKETMYSNGKDALCRMYEAVPKVKFETTYGMCNREAVASHMYARKSNRPVSSAEVEKCFTYKELLDRCGEVMSDVSVWDEYSDYYEGRKKIEADNPAKPSGPRKFYGHILQWRQCMQDFPTNRPADMLKPPNVLRLVKYDTVKSNLQKMNGAELAEYDARLEQAGLGKFKLGDITALERKDMNANIRGAIKSLEQSNRDPALLRMAQCMDQTFIRMIWQCSDSDLVTKKPKSKSRCLRSYEDSKPPRGEDEAC